MYMKSPNAGGNTWLHFYCFKQCTWCMRTGILNNFLPDAIEKKKKKRQKCKKIELLKEVVV